MAAPCPLNPCCSSCNATLHGTLFGCQFGGDTFALGIDGIVWTATQSGVVVASGTTHGGGLIDSFVVHSTAPVTMSYTGLPARTGIVPYTVTPVCGSTVGCGTDISLSGSGAYVCIQQHSSQPNYCLLPIATTLYLTSPCSGNLVALTYITPTGEWVGSEGCLAITPNPCGGGLSPNLVWTYFPATGSLQVGYQCGSSGPITALGSTTVSQTCPTLGGAGFSATGSITTIYFGGSTPITE